MQVTRMLLSFMKIRFVCYGLAGLVGFDTILIPMLNVSSIFYREMVGKQWADFGQGDTHIFGTVWIIRR